MNRIKNIVTSIIAILLLSPGVYAQAPIISIPGESDAVISDRTYRYLSTDLLKKGIYLNLSDSRDSIISYTVTFNLDFPTMILQKHIEGARWILTDNDQFWLDQLQSGAIFTVGNIRVIKNGKTGKRPSQIFYVTDPSEKEIRYTHQYPKVCHDPKKFLTSLNSGKSILRFKNGSLTEYQSWDSLFTYNYEKHEIQYVYFDRKNFLKDTVSINLEGEGYKFQRGEDVFTLSSFENIPTEIAHFGAIDHKSDKSQAVLFFNTKGRRFKLKLNKWADTWSWDVEVEYPEEVFYINLNSQYSNRAEFVYLENTKTGYGVSVSLTFRTRKKVWKVETRRDQPIIENGKEKIISDLGEGIWFEYNRAGRLKRGYKEHEICSCE